MLKKINLLIIIVVVFLSCTSTISDPGEAGDPFIELTSPNGYEVLQIGAPYTIEWTGNLSGNLKIEFFQGFDNLVMQFDDIPNNGQYQFTVPFDMTLGADYKVKLSSVQNPNLNDISESYFEISEYVSDGNDYLSSATLIDYIHTGDYAIYDEDDIDWYKVYLYAGNTYYFENTSENDFDSEFYLYGPENPYGVEVAHDDDGEGGSHQPKIEYYANETGYHYLRVAYYVNNPSKNKQIGVGYYALSVNGEWSGEIIVTSPNGGEDWVMGTGENINWVDNNSDNVDIDLYKNGNFHTSIESSYYNSGNYYWDIPISLDAGTDYKIRISNSEDSFVYDESDYFSISENDYVK
ncbi:MAG: hypothetical protein GQ534_01330 [Candidatus Delongbacteria bacterium]|nr:hypothetical protein [Candidatus Delongbacteria bacterium]